MQRVITHLTHGKIKKSKTKIIFVEKDLVETYQKMDCIDNNSDNILHILSIDIGINHMGMSMSTASLNYEFLNVVGIELIDITNFPHPRDMDRKSCPLKHTKTFADWMDHVFFTYDKVFQEANVILIERQPPSGLVAAEQLLFYKYRDKAELISPVALHKFFSIGGLTYDQRKEKTEKMCHSWMTSDDHTNTTNDDINDEETVINELTTKFEKLIRKHDVADSVCMSIFWLAKKHDAYLKQQKREEMRIFHDNREEMRVCDFLQQFCYSGKTICPDRL